MPMPAFAPVLRSSGEDENEDVDVGVEVCEEDPEVAEDDVERLDVDAVAVIGNCEVVKSFLPER
jgi:hypothetical protein